MHTILNIKVTNINYQVQRGQLYLAFRFSKISWFNLPNEN